MTTSKAIQIIEARHAFVLHKLRNCGYEDGRVNFMRGELVAMELAVEALAKQLLEERALRSARHATMEMLEGRSEC